MAESAISKLKFNIQKIEILIEELKKNSCIQKIKMDTIETEIKNAIQDINFRLESEYLSFKNIGKKIIFLASILGALFGSLQWIIQFLTGFLK